MPHEFSQRAARAADDKRRRLGTPNWDGTISGPMPAPAQSESAATPSAAEAASVGRAMPRRAHAERIAPAATDWLYHHLTVTGPADQLKAFQQHAAGAGVIPWRLDLDRMEEDFFLRLAASPAGGQRTLSLDGARMLAAELREAVGRRHAMAAARVGRSRACAFDLHALVPVPSEVLRLGPDHPDALSWLWTHWGTTDALRHVRFRSSPPATGAAVRVSFWAADWTPWRAVQKIRAAWPGLQFDLRPVYVLP